MERETQKNTPGTKKTPITYYGGKQMMLKHILPNIPQHEVYVEAFCGGAAVFFGKEKSGLEILNDTNREMMNFYETVQNDFVSLQKEIRISLHSRDLHRRAWVTYSNPDMFSSLKRAWALWTLSAQGFSGQLGSSWGRDRKENRMAKGLYNKRESFTEDYAIRLQDVTLESRDAVKLISSTDHEKVFFYCDPPYYNSDCGHYDGYTIEDFEMLLKTLSAIKGKFLLSSYPSELLKAYSAKNGWHTLEIEQRVQVSKNGRKKVEVLTANYPLKDTR